MKKLSLLTPLFFLAHFLQAQMTVSLETYVTGLNNPVDIAHCGDERLFVLERSGRVRIIDGSGNLLPTPFLDIQSQVNDSPNEQGLLGIAFHPDYQTNGYFYVNYTIGSEDSRVSRFSVSSTDPNVSDPTSEEIFLEVDQPVWNHNGGCMKFGPDGYLYISFGDGGSSGDPQDNGQNLNSLLGKMLRIDVDNGLPYTVPTDNPFTAVLNARDEIWAYGLRNPWRFSFDRVTGDMWIGDVGQGDREEVNFQAANSPGGENYGWRCYEGFLSFNTSNCPPMSEMVFPVMDYDSGFGEGFSVTGGFVYRGCEFPIMYGHYIFADYGTGKFWSITPDGSGGWQDVELANLANTQFSSFGENVDGQLFVASHGSGQISKVVPEGELLSVTDETCMGMGDGTIDFTIPTDQFASVMWNDGSTDAIRADLSPGIYGVTVSTTNGCEFSGSVEVNPGPGLGIPVEIMVVDDSLLSIIDVGADSYQWLLDGSPILGANGLEYTAQANGGYSVEMDFGNDCVFTSNDVFVMVSTSVLETLGLSSFSLSPNPFGNELTLQFSAPQNMDFEIRLTDLNGKEIKRHRDNMSGHFTKTFDLSDLASGIYLFKMKTERGEWSERVVKK